MPLTRYHQQMMMRVSRFWRKTLPALFVLCGCVPRAEHRFDLPKAASINAATRSPDAGAFWWGVSTSAYQTEEPPTEAGSPRDAASVDGSPARTNSLFRTDWDLQVASGKLKAIRDDRVASYSHIERDIAALKHLGVTHFRFGIEWA